MIHIFARSYQTLLRAAAVFMPWRRPELLAGEGAILQLPERVEKQGLHHVLLFVGRSGQRMPFYPAFLEAFRARGIEVTEYTGTVPNPTIANVEEAKAIYLAKNCDALIALGGGSQMDCAKVVGARIARPNKTVKSLRGLLKVGKNIPPLFVIPTTAGSGSEVTLAAVVSDPNSHDKFGISDPALIPLVAVLDPATMISLPQHITAETGMDALTHAVEAYIGRSNTKETSEYARRATASIIRNLPVAYERGADLAARQKMLEASYDAGVAFTRAYVGYVHALAHSVGGSYGIAHGKANAILLPFVLEAYGEAAHPRLAELADAAKISPSASIAGKAADFIAIIRSMNERMGIPDRIPEIRSADIPALALHADRESNPLYPVPRILTRKELEQILIQVSEAK